jgi:hypothetical protein
MQVDGESDWRTDMTKMIGAFRDYANASRREWVSNSDLLQWETVTGYEETESHLELLIWVQSMLLGAVKIHRLINLFTKLWE